MFRLRPTRRIDFEYAGTIHRLHRFKIRTGKRKRASWTRCV